MSNFFKPYGMDSQYDYPSLQEAQSVKPSTAPRLTPYLGLRSRLSQIWFNKWTVLLSLVIVRVWLATASLGDDIDSARREALSACTAVERAGSTMASMPHYLAPGVNEMSAKMVESSVHALQKTAGISITVVQELVIFAINMMLSTYVCLITLAVTGAASLVLDATQELMTEFNDTLKTLVTGISNKVNDFENALNKVVRGADKVGSLFGGELKLPTLDLPELKLDNVHIPTKYMDGIVSMQKSLDGFTFDDVKKTVEDAIKIPFKLIRQRVDSELGGYQFDRSIFPIPPKEKMTFCSTNNDIASFFDKLKETVERVRKIVIWLLVAAALLVMIPMALLERRRWRVTRERAYMFASNGRYDPVDVITLASRPSTGTFGLRIGNFFSSSRRRILIRWAVAYVTSPPALFVFSLGIAGVIGALSQYVVLKQVEAKTPELARQVGNFAGDVVDLVNNSSVKFAQSTNKAMNGVTNQINEEVFGWLTDGTKSINDTLNTFTNGVEGGIKKFLGGTPLEKPANDVVRCIIGMKIESIQKGLTWLHDNAKITFPQIPDDTFSKGAIESLDGSGQSFLADPQGATGDMITDSLLKMTSRWQGMITQEAAISGGLCLVWFVVLMIALVRTACFWWGKEKTRAEGGGVGTNFSGGAGPAGAVMAEQRVYPMVDVPLAMSPSPAYPGYEANTLSGVHRKSVSNGNNPFSDGSYAVGFAGKGMYPSQGGVDAEPWTGDEKGRNPFGKGN